ncbi:MAG: hypothetical protein ACI8PZ_006253 [Myxococcota bacterium]|jgi:hypothetical protein
MRASLPLLLLLGCMPDDWDGTPYDPSEWQTAGEVAGGAGAVDDTGAPVSAAAIAGTWVSTGDDLSELFAGTPFEYDTITAEFGVGGAYTVTPVDGAGATYPLLGTYVVDITTDPARITLFQDSPYAAEAEGIWSLSGDVLSYEVVQTVPDYGFTPPSPESGFGSTSGSGLTPGANVQVYRR